MTWEIVDLNTGIPHSITGKTITQALRNVFGKPVVRVGWSAVADFMTTQVFRGGLRRTLYYKVKER